MIPRPPLSRRNISALELFRGLSATALEDVLKMMLCHSLASDTRIFNQGDTPVRAHALIEGGVRIAQSGSDGGQIVVRFIGPGEMFGTMALFTDRRYPADAETLTDAVEVSWSEADLLNLMAAIRRLRSMHSRSSAGASRKHKSGCANFQRSQSSAASPTPFCGFPSKSVEPGLME